MLMMSRREYGFWCNCSNYQPKVSFCASDYLVCALRQASAPWICTAVSFDPAILAVSSYFLGIYIRCSCKVNSKSVQINQKMTTGRCRPIKVDFTMFCFVVHDDGPLIVPSPQPSPTEGADSERCASVTVRDAGSVKYPSSLSDIGGSSSGSGRTVPIFRKSGAVIPLSRPIHPESDRLWSLSSLGGSRRGSGRTVPIFRKCKANSELFNEDLRKSGAVIPLSRPIHPEFDRLLGSRRIAVHHQGSLPVACYPRYSCIAVRRAARAHGASPCTTCHNAGD
jgi:hypothetical protein